jgi:starch synthase
MKRVWLLAAENGAFPGGKVGGVGDVIRDLPVALAAANLEVRVITPSYGMFHKLQGTMLYRRLRVEFAGKRFIVKVFKVPVEDHPVAYFVIEHPLLTPCGPGHIYVADADDSPYAVDSSKFAFFNAVVATWVNVSKSPPHVLHLNDWHTGLIPALKVLGSPDVPLSKIQTVFTIHNLAYQGIRPLMGDESSLESWFPRLLPHADRLKDPRYDDCVNFMAAAIRLADGISTVSPTYAKEILKPMDPATGFSGGEGLEEDLNEADAQGRLVGILNGCAYLEETTVKPNWDQLLGQIGKHKAIIHANRPAREWLDNHWRKPPRHLLLSIGRVVAQKVPLFLEPVTGYDTALEAILAEVGPDALFVMLGSGERTLEERFVSIALANENFLYLRGYAEALSEKLYAAGDLFLMPSSFEPCGISQMLAMRAGQPCVVHGVGGLKDTVEDGVTGFTFDGDTPREQAEKFVIAVQTALYIKQHDPGQWTDIRENAARRRFTWDEAAISYKKDLYHIE